MTRLALWATTLVAWQAQAWPAELFSRAGPVPRGPRVDVVTLRQGDSLSVTVGLVTLGRDDSTLALLSSPGGFKPKVRLAPASALAWLDACTRPELAVEAEDNPCAPQAPASSPAPSPAAPVTPADADAGTPDFVELLPAGDVEALARALSRAGFAPSAELQAAFHRLSSLGRPVTLLASRPHAAEGELRLPLVQWTVADTGAGLPLDHSDGGARETQLWALEPGLAMELDGPNALLGEWPADAGVEALTTFERGLLARGDAVTEAVLPLAACRFDEQMTAVAFGLRPEAVEPPRPSKMRLSVHGPAAGKAATDVVGPLQSLSNLASSVRALGTLDLPRPLDEWRVSSFWVATRVRLLHARWPTEVHLRPAAPRSDGTSALFGAEPFAWKTVGKVTVRVVPARTVVRHPWTGPVTCPDPTTSLSTAVSHARPRSWTAGDVALSPKPVPRAASPSLPEPSLTLEASGPVPSWQRRFLEQSVLFTRQHEWLRRREDAPPR